MKILTSNFLTCAVKACKTSTSSFPLHFQDAELEEIPMDFNPVFLTNLLPRLEWDALRITARELGFENLPEGKPEFRGISGEMMVVVQGGVQGVAAGGGDGAGDEVMRDDVGGAGEGAGEGLRESDLAVLKDLHRLLLETSVVQGKMVCGNCGFEYKIKDGIANFLLPSHLV